MKILAALSFLLITATATANPTATASATASPTVILKGTLYELGSQRQKVLYTMQVTEQTDGSKTLDHTVFMDPAGKQVATEDTVLDNGKFSRYEIKNFQTGHRGFVEMRGTKAFFEYTKEGKTENDSEDFPENFIVPPTLVQLLKNNWPKILAGDDLSARFAVLDRKETVGFKFFKIGETETQGVKAIQVKMKPSSFVIAAIVKPLVFTLDAKDGRLLEIQGRTLPKIRDGDKWADLDADIVYQAAK